jgi:hypothetical protein
MAVKPGGYMTFNAWTLMLGVIGLFLNSVGLAFVAVQIALVRAQAARARDSEAAELALRRKESTVSFMVSTLEQRRSIWSQLPDDFNEDAIATFVKEITSKKRNQQREVELKGYLTMMETLALGVSIGIYDLPTVSQMMGSRISCVAQGYRHYIERRRRETGVSTLYVEIEWLDQQLERFRNTLPEAQRRSLRQPREVQSRSALAHLTAGVQRLRRYSS